MLKEQDERIRIESEYHTRNINNTVINHNHRYTTNVCYIVKVHFY